MQVDVLAGHVRQDGVGQGGGERDSLNGRSVQVQCGHFESLGSSWEDLLCFENGENIHDCSS